MILLVHVFIHRLVYSYWIEVGQTQAAQIWIPASCHPLSCSLAVNLSFIIYLYFSLLSCKRVDDNSTDLRVVRIELIRVFGTQKWYLGFFLFSFLLLLPHMEVPGPGIDSYMGSFKPLHWAVDQICTSTVTRATAVRLTHCPMAGIQVSVHTCSNC